ncbi:hypothetical protein JB92DRAFT_2206050 [Gautieria morchelliformis]|nr:hypothetical protein JB92DRAFT_2206050 [Gautieria morchelliformis]
MGSYGGSGFLGATFWVTVQCVVTRVLVVSQPPTIARPKPYSDDSCQALSTPTRSLHNLRTILNAISTQLDPAIRDCVLSLRLLGVRSPRERVMHSSKASRETRSANTEEEAMAQIRDSGSGVQ